jgi:CrcB protein
VRLIEVIEAVVGAGIGGGLRYALGGWIAERWGASFPWHTLVINVSGAFLLGLLMALTADQGPAPSSMRLFLGVGVLGGFTTFSTLSYESVALLERGLVAQGAANMFGSGVLGIAAAMAGLALGRVV